MGAWFRKLFEVSGLRTKESRTKTPNWDEALESELSELKDLCAPIEFQDLYQLMTKELPEAGFDNIEIRGMISKITKAKIPEITERIKLADDIKNRERSERVSTSSSPIGR